MEENESHLLIEGNKMDEDVFVQIPNTNIDTDQARLTYDNVRNRGLAKSTDTPLSDKEYPTLSRSKSRSHTDISDVELLQRMENEVEAHKISNNYLFGFKKWKGHVTQRPLSDRSEIVQDLYADISKVKPIHVSTIRPFNVLYALLFGWWMALLYCIVGCVMCLTILGYQYGTYCFTMAKYFIWPFGKFVHLVHTKVKYTKDNGSNNSGSYYGSTDNSTATSSTDENSQSNVPFSSKPVTTHNTSKIKYTCVHFLKRPQSYVWMILGLPVLFVAHTVVMVISWLLVISIPIAKVNFKAITQILFLPPDKVKVVDYSVMELGLEQKSSEIIMYTHRSVYVYYYKYTVDGMNIILVNMLVLVIITICLSYGDPDNVITSGVAKCILGVLAIIPLTYYIGLAIISISAQSSFALGAFINATFGSVVEIIIFVVTLIKGKNTGSSCYGELVKAALTGSIVGSMLFIPGICMVIGGIKHHSQRFNPKATSITALLLFVAVGGMFAPTLFSKIFGDTQCTKCEHKSVLANGSVVTDQSNTSYPLHCEGCKISVVGSDGNLSLYKKHIEPLVYACAILLFIAYIIGMVFSLKTHNKQIYGENEGKDKEGDQHTDHYHGTPAWSRIKSSVIMLISAALIALCAEIITNNIDVLLSASGISPFFIGMTMLAMIPELPEIVNGIQFALLNNVSLGIEIGTSTSIQVCMIQVPLLVLINIIYPFNFIALFNEVHLWSVIFSVIVINYTFQDGKSDYFQGSALVAVYLVLLCMYFFIPVPSSAVC